MGFPVKVVHTPSPAGTDAASTATSHLPPLSSRSDRWRRPAPCTTSSHLRTSVRPGFPWLLAAGHRFIDTNYNGGSFFVRHAYFAGADEPYEKLKRALRAEIGESTSNLYSTTSYPFEKPETGKIAVKVINHYGDEVLKVYEIQQHTCH